MATQRTALGRRLTEQRKARARLPLLTLVALFCLPLAGIRSAPIWICYVAFVLLYSLWALRLSAQFPRDRRLGYLLCLTDFAVLLPLLVWSSSAAVQDHPRMYLRGRVGGHVLRRKGRSGGGAPRILVRGSRRPAPWHEHDRDGLGHAAGASGAVASGGLSGDRLALWPCRPARAALRRGGLLLRRGEFATDTRGRQPAGAASSGARRTALPASRGRVAFLFEIESPPDGERG